MSHEPIILDGSVSAPGTTAHGRIDWSPHDSLTNEQVQKRRAKADKALYKILEKLIAVPGQSDYDHEDDDD